MRETLEGLGIGFDTLEALPEGLWRVGSAGDTLLDAWFTLHAHKVETGYSPLLIGTQHSLDLVWEFWEENAQTSVAEIEHRASTLGGRDYLEGRWQSYLTDFSGDEDPDPEALQALTEVNPAALHSDSSEIITDAFYAIWDVQAENIATHCFLLLIPNLDETTAHAYLRYGGWNDYPHAEEHLAVLRYWREKYGATLVALTSDTLELRLEQPIQDPEVALELAREHFAYTSDAVFQGVGSIQALAQSILNTNVWFFWWD